MSRWDSHKHPFHVNLPKFQSRAGNDQRQQESKSVPCHVVKIAKDFVLVAFETSNGIQTPPVVKMPQSFSTYQREPTQVGDKGYAVPGDYYMGGSSDYAGGNTNFYPRSNLASLSFQPVSKEKDPERDYDQHHQTGGPNGWIARSQQDSSRAKTKQNG